MSGKRPTLEDVAKAAGVSRATAARALSGNGYVDAARRAEIVAAADAMGYRTSHVARALRMRRSFSIGVLVPDITNPIFPRMVRGIDEAAVARGHTTFLCNTDERDDRQVAILRSLLDRQVDGLVLISQTLGDEALGLLVDAPPVVFVNRRPSGVTDYVGADNDNSIRTLVDHLWGLGHRRIGYARGPMGSSTVRERFDVFCRATAERGGSVDDSLVVDGLYTVEAGVAAARQLLAIPRPPTAIMAANDLVAWGIVAEAHRLGRRVPDDLSVTGFDNVFGERLNNYPLTAQRFTTIHQPKLELGEIAGARLFARMDEPDGPPTCTILPTRFVAGDTTAPPAEPTPPAAAARRAGRSPRG